MSKSSPDNLSRILLTDTPETIAKKLRGAVTDGERHIAYDPAGRRGVSNLLSICAGLDGSHDAHGWAEEANKRGGAGGAGGGSKVLKEMTAEIVQEKLGGVAREMQRLKGDRAYLSEVARDGRRRAGAKAGETLSQVRRLVGF